MRQLAHALSAIPIFARTLGTAMGKMADAGAPLLAVGVELRERWLLRMAADVTEFGGSVRGGLDRGDALPLLAYADWCEENGKPDAGSLARRVAAKMVETAAPPPTLCCPSPPVVTATLNGVPVQVTGWTVSVDH